jgi:hypothetical protein
VTKFGNVIKDAKSNSKEKRYCKYHKIVEDYFHEDYHQVNREARDPIQELKGKVLEVIIWKWTFIYGELTQVLKQIIQTKR